MRPQQWVKNLFVFAPLVFAHRLLETPLLARSLVVFAAFCVGSSAVYLLNDVRDAEVDRNHPLKRTRPVASGALSPVTATIVATNLALLTLGAGWWLGPRTLLVIAAYLLLNTLYSWWLKHVVILDVMVLALGYVLRVEAGAAAVDVLVSSWLLLCTIFVALFLGFSKRRHELVLLPAGAAAQRPVLEQYSPAFLDQMINVVTASTVLSYALYAISDESVAKHGQGLLYTVPLVLFGVFRYLFLVYQRPGRANPTEEVLSDPPFLLNMALWSACVLWILYGH